MTYSTTYGAAIVSFLTLAAAVFKFQLPDGINEVTIGQTAALVIGILSLAKILVERFHKGGVTPLGFKQPSTVTIDSLPDSSL